MKAVQYFSDEYLRHCRDMTPDQVIEYLDDFRTLHAAAGRSRSSARGSGRITRNWPAV